jgi:hypothetical protein
MCTAQFDRSYPACDGVSSESRRLPRAIVPEPAQPWNVYAYRRRGFAPTGGKPRVTFTLSGPASATLTMGGGAPLSSVSSKP